MCVVVCSRRQLPSHYLYLKLFSPLKNITYYTEWSENCKQAFYSVNPSLKKESEMLYSICFVTLVLGTEDQENVTVFVMYSMFIQSQLTHSLHSVPWVHLTTHCVSSWQITGLTVFFLAMNNTVDSLWVSFNPIYSTCLRIRKLCILSTHCIYDFYMIL
jgi:hypothetical protein